MFDPKAGQKVKVEKPYIELKSDNKYYCDGNDNISPEMTAHLLKDHGYELKVGDRKFTKDEVVAILGRCVENNVRDIFKKKKITIEIK